MPDRTRNGGPDILSTTEQLLSAGSARWPSRWTQACAQVILHHGSHVDAEALVQPFLADPEGLRDLLPVLARHGDAGIAQRLVARCFEGGRLSPAVPEEVLRTIGILGYEPATELLWNHVLDGDWYASRDACLGLAHLSCTELAADIQRDLIRYRARSLFPEFLPVLAAKTTDPTWPDELLDWGTYLASTDCNAGLLLGLSLYGERGRAGFQAALWSPRWEAHSTATGTAHWAYAGTLVLGLGMQELYEQMHARLSSTADATERVSCLQVMVGMLSCWVTRAWPGIRMADEPTESAAEVYEAVFEHAHPLDHVADLVERELTGGGALMRAVDDLRQRLELRVYQEAELELFRGPTT